MEDEIDLRQYITVLLKHWKLIVIITVLAGAVALAIGLLAPQAYAATARVSILKGDAALLLSLAKSNNIADEVGKEAAVNVKTADLTAGKILGAVQARQQGTLIEFTAQYNDPAKAAFMANAWVEQYAAYIDNYFRSTGQTPQEASSYADSIKKIYVEKQQALLDFEAASQIENLTQDISDLRLLIEILTFQDNIKSLSVDIRQDEAIKTLYYNYKTRAVTSQAGSAATDVDEMPEVAEADIDNLVSLLELRADVSHGITVEEIRSRIASLKYQLDAQTLKSAELTGQRDALLNAYQAALAEISAAEIAQATPGGYVRVADKAVAPDAPLNDNRKWINVAIALVAGFIVSAIGAFAVEYFSKKPQG